MSLLHFCTTETHTRTSQLYEGSTEGSEVTAVYSLPPCSSLLPSCTLVGRGHDAAGGPRFMLSSCLHPDLYHAIKFALLENCPPRPLKLKGLGGQCSKKQASNLTRAHPHSDTQQKDFLRNSSHVLVTETTCLL